MAPPSGERCSYQSFKDMVRSWQKVGFKTPSKVQHWMTLLGVLAVLGIGFWLKPDPRGYGTHRQLGFPPCTTFLFTGRPCPTCGMTTSVSACLHGNWRLAWKANPMGIPFLLLVLGMGFHSLWVLTTGRQIAIPPRLAAFLLLLLFAAMLVHGIWRFARKSPIPFAQRYAYSTSGEDRSRVSLTEVITTL